MVIRGAPARRRVGADHQRRVRARHAVALLVALLCLTATPRPSAAAATAADAAVTNLFASLSGSGWAGGDGTSSVALPDGRDCSIFSDTITSAPATGLGFAHNSIVVTGRGRLLVITDPIPGPSPNTFYWTGAARVQGGQLWEIAQQINQTGPGLWDQQRAGDDLAKIDISSWRLTSLTPGRHGRRDQVGRRDARRRPLHRLIR